MKLFINTATDSTKSLVAGLFNNSEIELGEFYVGDYSPIEFIFTNGLGKKVEWFGHPDVFVSCAIGLLAERKVLTKFDSNIITREGYKGYLNLSTSLLREELGTSEEKTFTFEVQISRLNQYSETYLQKNIKIRNQIIIGNKYPIPPSNIIAQ